MKPRKVKMPANNSENKKLKAVSTDKDYCCLVCGENFEEAWVQCKVCNEWAHEECADLSDSNYYFCDNCKM